jgi:hypothetical protein
MNSNPGGMTLIPRNRYALRLSNGDQIELMMNV